VAAAAALGGKKTTHRKGSQYYQLREKKKERQLRELEDLIVKRSPSSLLANNRQREDGEEEILAPPLLLRRTQSLQIVGLHSKQQQQQQQQPFHPRFPSSKAVTVANKVAMANFPTKGTSGAKPSSADLERSYPLSRMDAKKREKEARFQLLAKKAEEYQRERRDPAVRNSDMNSKLKEAAATSASEAAPSVPKENREPPPSHHALARTDSPVKKKSRRPTSPTRRATRSPSSSNIEKHSSNGVSLIESYFPVSLGQLNCVMPPIDECSSIDLWSIPSPSSIKKGKSKGRHSSRPRSAASIMEDLLVTPSPSTSSSRVSSARLELVRMRSELRKRKKTELKIHEKAARGEPCKVVRFAQPMVTEVRHRPYTKPEDVEKLFFIEEELDELEWDRANVDGDQFELVCDDDVGVSITYKNRMYISGTKASFAEPIPYSTSDLSALE